MPSKVWGLDQLSCPNSISQINAVIRHAWDHPWMGNEPLMCRLHGLETTAITEPGMPTRIRFSLDHGYHQSGWFANSEFERCLHLSISHPRPDRPKLHRTPEGTLVMGIDCEAPSHGEIVAWGRVFFRAHAQLALMEPAVGPGDQYRSAGVAHLRLWVDKVGRPFKPEGEVYHHKPFPDGSSPAKIVGGRLGADVK